MLTPADACIAGARLLLLSCGSGADQPQLQRFMRGACALTQRQETGQAEKEEERALRGRQAVPPVQCGAC